MDRKDLDRHMMFLNKYATENGIIFSVTRTGVKVEEVGKIDV